MGQFEVNHKLIGQIDDIGRSNLSADQIAGVVRATIERLEARDLSIEMLKNSGLPDQCLFSLWLDFKSEKGNAYRAVVVRDHPNGAHILLSSESKDEDEFKKVANEICRLAGTKREAHISDRETDICEVLKFDRSHRKQILNALRIGDQLKILGEDSLPTQRGIALLGEKLSERFNSLSISRVFFKDLTVKAMEECTLPQMNLIVS